METNKKMLNKITTELKKRFSKNGQHRKALTELKKLKKEYPENEMIHKLIKFYRQKIYGIKGKRFLHDKIIDLFETNFTHTHTHTIFEIENLKFDLDLHPSTKKIFCTELIDLLCSDDYFKKSESNYLFYQTMKILQDEGPYQYNSVSLQPNDTVIDVGANIGMFSIFANHFYGCKCYAFEPVSSTAKLLLKNLVLNKMEESIVIEPYALSDKVCDLDIWISKNNINAASFVINPEDLAGLEKIHCITLDQWVKENDVQKIDFIKADIEGAERYMLQGATNVLKTFAPKLSICTYHLPDDPQVLEDIILKTNPKYKVEQASKKLYAYVP